MSQAYESLREAIGRSNSDKVGRIVDTIATRFMPSWEVRSLFVQAWCHSRKSESMMHYLITGLESPLAGLLQAISSYPDLAKFAFGYREVRWGLLWLLQPTGKDAAPPAIQAVRDDIRLRLTAAVPAHLARYVLQATFPPPNDPKG